MKKILRHYIIVTYALWLTTKIASGIFFENGTRTLLFTGVVFMGASLLAKPVINILLLPLNLVTFGFFRWVSSAIVLYLVTLVVPAFKLISFNFPGYTSKWIELPVINFQGFLAYIAFAFLISLLTSFLFWLMK
ncbi:phage holin family protein [Candidatus Woesebacteria bacterium]|nr:phage holin family protein [Candidatus Woesebacteria bacterium]